MDRYRTMELKGTRLSHSLPLYVEAILPPDGGFENEQSRAPNYAVHVKSFLLFQPYNRENVFIFFSDG